MYGLGLLKGLKVTLKHCLQREVTEQYPEQRPDLPPASHYFFRYEVDKCIACGLCVRACPNQVIFMATEKDENNKKIITDYTMKLEYCLYCGLCIEACPTDALLNDPDFETSCYTRKNLEFNFLEPIAKEHADGFQAKQDAYWQKKRPEGSPIGKPEPLKPTPQAKPKPTPEELEAMKKKALEKKQAAEAAKAQQEAGAPAEEVSAQAEAKAPAEEAPAQAAVQAPAEAVSAQAEVQAPAEAEQNTEEEKA